MIVIGLTGTSGSGKGYVCALLDRRGIPSIDTDAIVHGLYTPGSACVAELIRTFGDGILHPDGSVNRRALAEIVFSDPERLTLLNGIVHRYVLDTVRGRIRTYAENGAAIVIVDAPQLFESGFDRECDKIVAVVADRDIRERRLLSRDTLSLEQIRSRISNQHDDRFFEENCDFVIRNNGSEDLQEQIDAILAEVSAEGGRKP